MMTWAPSFGPARLAPVHEPVQVPAYRGYSPPVSLIKKVQGDIVYSDDCRRNIPVPTFVVTEPNKETNNDGIAHA